MRLGFWGAAFFALTTYTSLHALWEIEEFMFDRYLGTNLQPGGMAEATRNNLSGIAGAVVGVGLLRAWSRAGDLRRALGLETPVAASAMEPRVEA